MALLVTMALAGLTLGLLQIGLSFNREQSVRLQSEQALFLAEAGLAESLSAMRGGGSGAVATQALPAAYGDGVFWVEVADVGVDLRLVTSAAMHHGGRACLQRLVFHFFPEVFTTAIFSNRDLTLEANTFVDSFDSRDGTYADQLAASGGVRVDDGAVVISNGDITVDSAADLYADLHPGEDGTVTIHSSSDVSGTLEPLVEPRDLPPVVVPPIPISGDLEVLGGTLYTLPPGDHGFDDLRVESGAVLTVTGPARILVDDFDLRSSSSLVLDTTGGRIEFFIRDEARFRSNSAVVTPQMDARDVAFHFVGDSSQVVELRSNSTFHGTLYCPEGTIDVRSNFEVFGSVVADKVIVNSNSKIHFDEALLELATGPEVFQFGAWTLAAFPVRAWLLDRSSPFELLGLTPADLPLPYDARAPAAP